MTISDQLNELRSHGHVAIVGAGEMGSAIATVCVAAGYRVVLADSLAEALPRSLKKIERNLGVLVEGGLLGQAEADAALARAGTAADLRGALVGAGLMIEAVPEVLEMKQDVFRAAEKFGRPEAILATNASGIPTTQIAAACAQPERVCGIHFFNPPFILRAVEAIRGERTSDATFEWAIAFIESVGSVPIRVLKDEQSFVINNLQQALRREAARLVEAGVTTKEDIDRAAAASFGIKYATFGPMRSADLTSPASPLRQGKVSGEGLAYDYSEYGAEETFRRRDLAFIETVNAARDATNEHTLE